MHTVLVGGRRTGRFCSPAAALLLALGLTGHAQGQPVGPYKVIDLGCLPGHTSSQALAMNSHGWVVGASGNSVAVRLVQGHAFIWRDSNSNRRADPGEMVDLGVLPGQSMSAAFGVNDLGQVVGASGTGMEWDGSVTGRAFLVTPRDSDGDSIADTWWADDNADGFNDLMIDLGTLGMARSEARAINNHGQVVGFVSGSGPPGSRAFLWHDDNGNGQSDAGEMSPLYYGMAGGYPPTQAYSINEIGQVAGDEAVSGWQAFLWSPGGPNGRSGSRILLAAAAPVGTTISVSHAYAVNNAPAVQVGCSVRDAATGADNPALWTDADQNGAADPGELQTLPRDKYEGGIMACDVNDDGVAIGPGRTWWPGGTGTLHLFRPGATWAVWQSENGHAINNALQIAATCTRCADMYLCACLWIPNRFPLAAADAWQTAREQTLSVTAPGVLANDADPDGDLFLGPVLRSGPAHGTLHLNPDGSFTYTPAAGFTGIDTFVYRARDDGYADSPDTTVTIAVIANRAPTAEAGPDQALECAGPTTPVSLDGTGSSDPDGDALAYTWKEGEITLGSGPSPTISLGKGGHTLTLAISDGKGAVASDTVTITLGDTTAPTVTPPPDITRNTDPGEATAAFDPGTATATDLVDGAITALGTRPDGKTLAEPYPIGTTTITWTATDAAGNQAETAQRVTVTDSEPPTLTDAPAAITRSTDPGRDTAAVDLVRPTAADNSGSATLGERRSDGKALSDPYPLGTTTITWTAADPSGNRTEATTNVTVVDQEPPAFQMPADFTVAQDCAGGAAVTFSVTATDNSGWATVSTAPASGAVFPLGTTTVNCTATDAAGNTATGSFTVTVVVPDSTASNKVTGGGRIAIPGGEASFAMVEITNAAGEVKGNLTFQDHVRNKTYRSLQITALVVTGTHGRIFGKASVDGAGSVDFVADVDDLGTPGTYVDRFAIQFSDGFAAAGTVIDSGNIQVH